MRLCSHPMSFAESLKSYRQAHSLTQAQLAYLIPGCPIRTAERWETGNPPPGWMQKLILSRLENAALEPPILSKYARNKIAAKVAAKIAASQQMQDELVENSAKMARTEKEKENENNCCASTHRA